MDELRFSLIDWGAFAKTIPLMLVLGIMSLIDSLLYLTTTKSELKVPCDMVKEVQVIGQQTLIASLFMGVPGYSQHKFNVLNYEILGNTEDRRPGAVVGILAGVLYFWVYPFINYLPRFYLAGILVYAASPFVEDHLIMSYYRVTRKEFACIWIIALTNAIAAVWIPSYSLLIAIIAGFVIAALIFMVQYSRVSVIRDSLTGQEFHSVVMRQYVEERLLDHIGVRFRIIELQGFIFFATATQVLDEIKSIVYANEDPGMPVSQRVRYLALDFKHVQNIDHSGSSTFVDVCTLLKEAHIGILFTGLNRKVHKKLSKAGIATADDSRIKIFDDLDRGAEFVEDLMLQRATIVRRQWLVFDSFKKLHTQAILKATFEAFEAVLGSVVGNHLWKYAQKLEFAKGEIICREGELNHTLFVLQTGKVSSYRFLTDAGGDPADKNLTRLHTITRGAFMNDECLFFNVPVKYSSVADEPSVVWAVSRKKFLDMEAHEPHLALEVMRAVLQHSSKVLTRLEREVSALERCYEPNANHHTANRTKVKLGATVVKEIERARNAQRKKTVDFGDHHAHHFEHFGRRMSNMVFNASRPSTPRPRTPSLESLPDVQPHLSKQLHDDAVECFRYHARIERGGRRKSVSYSPSSSPAHAPAARISLGELQKAVMDLGFFPTRDELRKMHESIGHASAKIDREEFLEVVKVLALARLSENQMNALREIYFAHCDEQGNLWRDDLRALMVSIGHPEDEVELEATMHEWDVQHRGYLDFDAFISMISFTLKKEELDEMVEEDFLKLSNRVADFGSLELATRGAPMTSEPQITADSLVRALEDMGIGASVDLDLIEEMIFDADFDGAGFVSLDDLISTIAIIGRKEIGSGSGEVPAQAQGRIALAKLKSAHMLTSSSSATSATSLPRMSPQKTISFAAKTSTSSKNLWENN